MRWIIAIVALLIGYQLTFDALPTVLNFFNVTADKSTQNIITIFSSLIFAIIFFIITPYIFRRMVYYVDSVNIRFQKTPAQDIVVCIVGLVSGLILANLLTIPLVKIPFIGSYLPVVANVLLGYLGLMIAWRKRDELAILLALNKNRSTSKNAQMAAIKVLDTSVIIDGRIADICSTGIIEGTIGIPIFVLQELQYIADSADALRRNRGRRGLDVLNRMQKELGTQVKIFERDYPDITEVDSKLISLAQDLNATIITNDYNLNKVCRVQSVEVLNINELANSVKPVVLPGEEMSVLIIKDGKENSQGIGYLDDGTMIVVEGGRKFINEAVKVVVTSVLQTAAGRMIFTKLSEKAS